MGYASEEVIGESSIDLNRKMLAQLAVLDNQTFKELILTAK